MNIDCECSSIDMNEQQKKIILLLVVVVVIIRNGQYTMDWTRPSNIDYSQIDFKTSSRCVSNKSNSLSSFLCSQHGQPIRWWISIFFSFCCSSSCMRACVRSFRSRHENRIVLLINDWMRIIEHLHTFICTAHIQIIIVYVCMFFFSHSIDRMPMKFWIFYTAIDRNTL